MNDFQFILTYLGVAETLTILPDGTDRLGISYVRNKTYSGILRSFANGSFRFVRLSGGGGETIKTAYDTYGLNANVTITINIRNPQTDDYDFYYSGILDFKPNTIKIERDYVEVGVIDGSKENSFANNDEIDFDLNSLVALNGNAIDAFATHPKDIRFEKIDIYLQCVSSGDYNHQFFFGYDQALFPGILMIDPDTSEYSYYYSDEIEQNEIGERFASTTGPLQSNRSNKIYSNDTDFTCVIRFNDISIVRNTLNYGYTLANAEDFHWYLWLSYYDSSDVLLGQYYVDQGLITIGPGISPNFLLDDPLNYITVDVSALIGKEYTIPSGGYLKLDLLYNAEIDISNPSGWVFINITRNEFNEEHVPENSGLFEVDIDFTEISLGEPDSLVKCWYPHEAFTRLIQLMTGETDQTKLLYSGIFGNTSSEFVTYTSSQDFYASVTAITNGITIRGFLNKPININFRDLFKTLNCVYHIGCAYDRVNERFYIEDRSEFFDADYYMFDLGEVTELKISPYREAFFNKINSGYNYNGQYEDFNGVYEFNVMTEHAVDLPVKETLDMRAPYNADSIGMELARRYQYSRYSSKDTKYDDLIYIVRTTGIYTKQGGTSESGFEGIEYRYNLEISPRENLIRNGSSIRPGLWKNTTEKIKFINSKKSDFTYQNQNGDTVDEFDDILGTELPDDRLYNPEYYEFKGIFTVAIAAILHVNPHGVVRFTFNGVSYEGFVDEIISEQYNKTATYKLIAKDATDSYQKVFMNGDSAQFMDGDNHLLI